MKKIIRAALFSACLLGAGFARADTDYACFRLCTANGTDTSSTCLKKCAYDPNQPANAAPHADLKCLKLCSDGGTPYGACIPQCTAAMSLQQGASPSSSAPATHDVLKAPIPTDELILRPHGPSGQGGAPEDYNCITQCVRAGLQSALCNQRCAK